MFYYAVHCTSKALVSTSSSEEHRTAETVSFDILDVTCTVIGVYEMLKVSLKSFISFTPLMELQKNDDHTVILSKLAFTMAQGAHHKIRSTSAWLH